MFKEERIDRGELVKDLLKKANKLYSNLAYIYEDGGESDELKQLQHTIGCLEINLNRVLNSYPEKIKEFEKIKADYSGRQDFLAKEIEKRHRAYKKHPYSSLDPSDEANAYEESLIEKCELTFKECGEKLRFFSNWLEEIGWIALPKPKPKSEEL